MIPALGRRAMWEWSRSVAERATAASWTRSAGEPAPTITDSEVPPAGVGSMRRDVPEYDLAG